MKNRFYLCNGEVWRSDNKSRVWTNVSNPELAINIDSLSQEEVSMFKEIIPTPGTYVGDCQQERLYRVLINVPTITFLTKESFDDIYSNVCGYLQEIEEYERLCVIREIRNYYLKNYEKKQSDIQNQIKNFDKSETK